MAGEFVAHLGGDEGGFLKESLRHFHPHQSIVDDGGLGLPIHVDGLHREARNAKVCIDDFGYAGLEPDGFVAHVHLKFLRMRFSALVGNGHFNGEVQYGTIGTVAVLIFCEK